MLLHACCATCLLAPYDDLKDHFDITVLYYNPNIYPRSEYIKRLKDVRRVCRDMSIPLIVGPYRSRAWLKKTEHLKEEPEGGKRCGLCFGIRLEYTALTAVKKGFDIFGTTLTVSPHKNQEMINSIGLSIAGKLNIQFFRADFKKNDGFKRTMHSSKKLRLYRQNYCGCIYSIKH
ncbi:MAG: epoxyqueuosine reductase QueH [Actinobacteria bacterium]|nr:epoxyqueuosine reductase QueH [Actinomycetota bacterium]